MLKDRCPGCSRYVGQNDECPYCGYEAVRPGLLRLIRYGSLLFALSGIVFLYCVSMASDVPLVKAGWISPAMNYARVRVCGVVERRAYVSEKGGRVDYIAFTLNDGTGEIRVSAHDDFAQDLHHEGRIPEKDSYVEAEGKLRILENGKKVLRAEELSE